MSRWSQTMEEEQEGIAYRRNERVACSFVIEDCAADHFNLCLRTFRGQKVSGGACT